MMLKRTDEEAEEENAVREQEVQMLVVERWYPDPLNRCLSAVPGRVHGHRGEA